MYPFYSRKEYIYIVLLRQGNRSPYRRISNMQRRQFLLSSLAADGVFALPGDTAACSAASPLKIGFCYPGPIGDVAWTYELNADVPADVAKLFNAKKAQIVSGTFRPFTGPIKDNEAKERVAAGKLLSEEDPWSLKWYAERVLKKVSG